MRQADRVRLSSDIRNQYPTYVTDWEDGKVTDEVDTDSDIEDFEQEEIAQKVEMGEIKFELKLVSPMDFEEEEDFDRTLYRRIILKLAGLEDI